MGIAMFDPSAQAIVSFTPAAIAHLRRQVGARAGVRLGIKRAGCSGYMYEVELVDTGADSERAIVVEGVTVFIDQQALPLLRGTEVDYVQSGLNSSLKFRNPNASAECGCGESFAVS